MQVQRERSAPDVRAGARGFTLVEVLVVIIVLGVLGAVVVFSVRGTTKDSQDSSCKAERRMLETAVESYYSSNFTYPADAVALETAGLVRDTVGLHHTVAGGSVTGTGVCA